MKSIPIDIINFQEQTIIREHSLTIHHNGPSERLIKPLMDCIKKSRVTLMYGSDNFITLYLTNYDSVFHGGSGWLDEILQLHSRPHSELRYPGYLSRETQESSRLRLPYIVPQGCSHQGKFYITLAIIHHTDFIRYCFHYGVCQRVWS